MKRSSCKKGERCYFWLSYYDQSLDIPESFDFDTEEELRQHNIDMYDFLPNGGLMSMAFDGDIYGKFIYRAEQLHSTLHRS